MEDHEVQALIEQYRNRIRDLEHDLALQQAREEFLTSISHELRTRLSPIIGFSRLLLETTSLTKEQMEYVNSLLNSGGYPLLYLVSNWLDFRQLSHGSLHLQDSIFSLQVLIDQTIERCSSEAAKKEIILSGSIEAGLVALAQGDEYRLGQILRELVRNAIKYVAAGTTGKVEIVLSLRQIEGTDFLFFEVKDTGINIPSEVLEAMTQCFDDPGYNLAIRSVFSFETSLGLMNAKMLCDLMKGKIWVRSQGAQGSIFGFAVPYQAI